LDSGSSLFFYDSSSVVFSLSPPCEVETAACFLFLTKGISFSSSSSWKVKENKGWVIEIYMLKQKVCVRALILTSVSSSIVCLDLFEAVDAVSAPAFLFRLWK
jgi:hypothetical protein